MDIIDERKNEQTVANTSNTGCSQLIKDHGCGCGLLAVVMVVLSLVLLLILSPFLPKDDEGAHYDPGFLAMFYIGAFLVISGFYYFVGKLIRCRIPLSAQKIVLNGNEITESPISIYPPNENDKNLKQLCVFEYDFEGTKYRVLPTKCIQLYLSRHMLHFQASVMSSICFSFIFVVLL